MRRARFSDARAFGGNRRRLLDRLLVQAVPTLGATAWARTVHHAAAALGADAAGALQQAGCQPHGTVELQRAA